MEILNHIKDEELIKEIKNGDKSLLKLYYLKEKETFIQWATKNFGISEKKAFRLYNASFLKFFEMLVCWRIKEFKFLLKDALYSFASFIMSNDPEFHSELGQAVYDPSMLPDYIHQFLERTNGQVYTANIKMKAIWDSLDKNGKDTIKMLYYENMEPSKIADKLGLSDEDEVMQIKEDIFTKFFKVL